MAVVVDNYNDSTYTLVLNSNDKVAGTNNNATFQVNWKDFLPEEYDRYKMVFTFQTTGGFYGDGIYPKSPSVSPAGTLPINGTLASNATSFFWTAGTLPSPVPAVGQYIVGNAFPSGCQVVYYASSGTSPNYSMALTASQPTLYSVGYPLLTLYRAVDMNAVNFSSGRVVFSTSSRSYSYDTNTNAPSVNLGVITRDLQTTNTRSNTLSCFYCQNPPRTINRPTNNLVTISVYNNCVFQGGFNVGGGTTATASNLNLLTDTANTAYGGAIGFTNDMTPWTMLIEFIPVTDSKKKLYYEH